MTVHMAFEIGVMGGPKLLKFKGNDDGTFQGLLVRLAQHPRLPTHHLGFLDPEALHPFEPVRVCEPLLCLRDSDRRIPFQAPPGLL